MSELNATTPAFGVFERDVLPERIAARLISLIAERQLQPGEKLPSERDLAAMMRGQPPVAARGFPGGALAMLNVVEIRQGSGTYVTSLKSEMLIEHLDFVFGIDDTDLRGAAGSPSDAGTWPGRRGRCHGRGIGATV